MNPGPATAAPVDVLGTLVEPGQAADAARAGARFAVSPGFDPELLQACMTWAPPLLPGAATATEILRVHRRWAARQLFGRPVFEEGALPANDREVRRYPRADRTDGRRTRRHPGRSQRRRPWAVILPSLVNPIGTFLVRVYSADSVPDSLIESGRLDGASDIGIFLRISLRMLMPGLITVFLSSLVSTWNNYFLPLVMLNNPNLYPVTVGLAPAQRNSQQWRLVTGPVLGSGDRSPALDHPADHCVPAAAAVLAAGSQRRSREVTPGCTA